MFTLGKRIVDLDRREVRLGDEVIPLTANEVGLLTVLALRPGEVVDRDRLMVEGLGYRKGLQSRAIDQAVWRLRKKIEDEAHRPLHLRSEPHIGYWLVLATPSEARLFGRRRALDAVSRWVAEGQTVCLVGPPGIGRRRIAAAFPEANVRIATEMPTDPGVRALRVGLLSGEEAAQLLVDRVLAARGTTALGPGEAQAIAPLVRRMGGQPGVLVGVAEASVLHPLGHLLTAPQQLVPAVVDFVDALPHHLRAVAATLASVPDPLPGEEAAACFGSEAVRATWRASAIEAIDQDGERCFTVLPSLRQALGESAPPDLVSKLRAHLVQTLGVLADRVLQTGHFQAVHALRARSATVRSLLEQTQEPALLRVLLAEPGPMPLPPLPEAGGDADAAVCRALLVAAGFEWTDPTAWAAHIEAAQHLPASPLLDRVRITWWVTALGHLGAPAAQLEAALVRLARVSEQIGTPMARAAYLVVRGQVAALSGRPDQGLCDLVAALRLFEGLEAHDRASGVRSNLAALALSDGRIDEGIGWMEEALARPMGSVEEEAVERLRLAELLLAAGRTIEVERQLALVDALGTHADYVSLERAWVALLTGQPQRAEVRARALLGTPVKPRGFTEITLGWARLLQGDAQQAATLFEALERPDAWHGDPIDLRCSLVVALAAAGRATEAQHLLETAPPDGPAWWEMGQRVAAALIERAGGRPKAGSLDALAHAADGPHRSVVLTASVLVLLA